MVWKSWMYWHRYSTFGGNHSAGPEAPFSRFALCCTANKFFKSFENNIRFSAFHEDAPRSQLYFRGTRWSISSSLLLVNVLPVYGSSHLPLTALQPSCDSSTISIARSSKISCLKFWQSLSISGQLPNNALSYSAEEVGEDVCTWIKKVHSDNTATKNVTVRPLFFMKKSEISLFSEDAAFLRQKNNWKNTQLQLKEQS